MSNRKTLWGVSLLMLAALTHVGVDRVVAQSFTRSTDQSNPIVSGVTSQAFTGCAWIDIDNDELLDLFIADAGGSHLYHNDGGGVFSVVAGNAFASDAIFYRGASWADYDNDGDLDCFLAGQAGALFRNDGGSFTKMPDSVLGTSDTRGWSPAWGDYDRDGYLDMMITFPSGFVSPPNRPNRMLHNDGPPHYHFTVVDTGVIVTSLNPYTSCNWSDYDLDGDIDLFIGSGPANVIEGPDDLYQNMLVETGVSGFTRITTAPLATSNADGQVWNWIDIDNDGDLDAYRTNWGGSGGPLFRPNDLFRNDNGTYVQITTGAIVTDADVSLSSAWGDFDNDGDIDCYVANQSPDRLYTNNGDGTFTSIAGGDIVGQGNHMGASVGDFDNDGDLDIFANGPGAGTRALFINTDLGFNHWIKIKLTGDLSNKSAIGARARIKATINGNPVWQIREISAQNTFLGHNSLIVHFGLGDAVTIDSLQITWPSGIVFDTANVGADQLLKLTEQCADPDGDGATCFDNCPSDANADQADDDGDGIGNVCDACPNDPDNDADGDGLCGNVDTCPNDPDNDIDGDGVCADVDNCPLDANADQADDDGDGIGNVCDDCPFDPDNDIDGDGVCGDLDNCPVTPNLDQADNDADGIGNACCCVGSTGNVDADPADITDIADLTFLIDHLFISFPQLDCPAEGNVDGDAAGVVDIADLTALIDHLFINFPPTATCQ